MTTRICKLLKYGVVTLAAQTVLMGGNALAQSTTGSLTGEAPRDNTTIFIRSDTGLSREIPVDSRGRYLIQQLPLGTYQVQLKRNGQVIESRDGVVLTVNSTTDVSFGNQNQKLEMVTVESNATRRLVDMGSVDSRTVITAAQLDRLPLGHSAEAIAKLAPGVVGNGGGFSGPTGESLLSFGGASVSENAYYINGFNTTNSLSGFGGITLPYSVVDQQEVFTGGFGAKYGRSAGGVINAIGKRGTSEWRFGGRAYVEPRGARSKEGDVYYPGTPDLYNPKSLNRESVSTQSIYAGGPLIADKLFFFGAYEQETSKGTTVGGKEDADAFTSTDYRHRQPRWYAKLDWNITDDHLLEFTSASSRRNTRGNLYAFNYDTVQRGDARGEANETRTGGEFWSAKYTGYLTDKLTVSALYGRSKLRDYVGTPDYDPTTIYLANIGDQNPLYTLGTPIQNNQTTQNVSDPGRRILSNNLRLDLNYVWGRHNITAGIDNQTSRAVNYGERASGPEGFYWDYRHANPNELLSSGLGVPATAGFPNGQDGYYVIRQDYLYESTVESAQRAQYIEDNWQMTDKLLLSLGLRLDQFTNYNGDHDAYIKQTKGQWAPRVGFSFDVNGDGSAKLFGNLGRYYLALPLRPAFGSAGAPLSTSTFYTYGGIDAKGYPINLTKMAGPVSALNYFGKLPDPKTVATEGIKPSFQDEMILGFTSALDKRWVVGVKGTYRTLRAGIDDYCDSATVFAKAHTMGFDVTQESNPVSCWLFNPGRANTFTLVDTHGEYVSVPMSREEMGMPAYSRKYQALNLALEHPFHNGWYGKVDYTYSKSYGTTEGQVVTGIQQDSVSTTIDWDFAQLMEHTYGPQSNDHRHQLKLLGYYQVTPEWLVSANFSLVSGAPRVSLGSYIDPSDPANTDPVGYGPTYYHSYKGEPSPPGSRGRLPWTTQLDLGFAYKPALAGGKLKFSVDVFNVLNGKASQWEYPHSEDGRDYPLPLYGAALLRQAPRSVRVGVSYDF